MIVLDQLSSPMNKNILWKSQGIMAVKDIKVVVFLPFRATADFSPRPEPVTVEEKIFLETERMWGRRQYSALYSYSLQTPADDYSHAVMLIVQYFQSSSSCRVIQSISNSREASTVKQVVHDVHHTRIQFLPGRAESCSFRA